MVRSLGFRRDSLFGEEIRDIRQLPPVVHGDQGYHLRAAGPADRRHEKENQHHGHGNQDDFLLQGGFPDAVYLLAQLLNEIRIALSFLPSLGFKPTEASPLLSSERDSFPKLLPYCRERMNSALSGLPSP